MTTTLTISAKRKEDPTGFVSISDFEWTPGTPIDPQQILDDPTISLYCLDHPNQRAIFTQTPSDIDLTQFPFFYQAQFEHAQQLIAVPYDTLYKLTADISQEKNLILIYSVGRCGSTLLSQVFDTVDGILSLSEPDFFTNIVLLREENGRSDPTLTKLLRSCMLILQKPLPQRNPDTWAIKFRSSGFEIADLIQQASPTAKNIFLYRDAIQRTRSEARAFNLFAKKPVKMNAQLLQRWIRLIPLMAGYKRKAKWGRLSRIEISALAWLSRMDRYLTLHEQGANICGIRYEDMTSQPAQVISELFSFCNISQKYVQETLHVFQRDSQAGSSLAKKKVAAAVPQELTPKHIKQIQNVIQKHDIITSADYLLPGTIATS
ncbi:MAG: hypothetical protein GY943_35390 [Chloroflexi bacterium]|nr:hypothetical protein [Chloroflexota bacterium]